MLRKYVRFLLTNICSYYIMQLQNSCSCYTDCVIVYILLIDCYKGRCISKIAVRLSTRLIFRRGERKMRNAGRSYNKGDQNFRRRNRRNAAIKRIRRFSAAVILVLCVCLSFGTFLASAHESETNPVHTYYKSVRIQPGDTLWSIAEDTMTSEYDSVSEYVEVLKDMNGLTSDNIQSGANLIIAYEL